jgi:hypothetical protein
MIDKVPEATETTTLQCQLPKVLVERLTEIARQRSLTLDEVLGQAVDQSCERWRLDQEFGPAEVVYSAPDIPRPKGTPVVAKPGPPRQPRLIVESISAPAALPLNDPKFVDTIPVPDLLPQPFRNEA